MIKTVVKVIFVKTESYQLILNIEADKELFKVEYDKHGNLIKESVIVNTELLDSFCWLEAENEGDLLGSSSHLSYELVDEK